MNCQSDATELDFAPGYPVGLLILVSVVCFGLALIALVVALMPSLVANIYIQPSDVRGYAMMFGLFAFAFPFVVARKTHIHCTKCDARWRR